VNCAPYRDGSVPSLSVDDSSCRGRREGRFRHHISLNSSISHLAVHIIFFNDNLPVTRSYLSRIKGVVLYEKILENLSNRIPAI
jgi:hypothetical protein